MTVAREVTLREFIESAPLYTSFQIELPQFVGEIFPTSVTAFCRLCGGNRPFQGAEPPWQVAPTVLVSGVTLAGWIHGPIAYSAICGDCHKSTLRVWFNLDQAKRRAFKVGQMPAFEIQVSPSISTVLGEDDTSLYERALRLTTHGLGIGACAYLRRVFDHQIGPLLALVREARIAEAADAVEIAAIDAAITSKRGDERTHVLYGYAPKNLIVGGTNPLKLIYGDLSDGLHNLTDEQATQLATDWNAAFEFVLETLGRDRQARQTYLRRVRESNAARSEPERR